MTTDLEARVKQLVAEHPPESTPEREFHGARYDAGLAWVHFPEGYGGLGLAPDDQAVVDRALRAAGAPMPDFDANVIGQGMAAPTILVHGTEELKQKHLRPCFTNEDIWCQLFSEPVAGSDVAGLATRAVRDGDEWIVNGQKVWTTLAHVARWGLLVARTDPAAPKHKGMTYFVLDMHAPGVEVRPLRQMTGDAEFNEVFLTDARIPDSNRLDAVGEGWRVALTTLMNERVSIGGGVGTRGSGPIGQAVKLFKSRPADAATRDRLMRLWVESEAVRLTNMRARQMRKAGTPGPEGSVAKLAFAELNKRIYELCTDLMGPDGQLYEGDYAMRRPERAGITDDADPRYLFLRTRANSIEGGTSEVMRNILGERVLGLPGEPRTDRDVAWADVPRN
jgi:alkylation response protein AidB-like acyl-CoA dehydrogenase